MSIMSDADAFATFARAYEATDTPEFPHQLARSLQLIVFAACRKYGASEEAALEFFKELQARAFPIENMAVSATLIWTSAITLQLSSGSTIVFCSLLNRILRERDPDLLPPGCGVVRGINLLRVTRHVRPRCDSPPAASRNAVARGLCRWGRGGTAACCAAAVYASAAAFAFGGFLLRLQ